MEQVIFPELSVRPGAVWALPLPACHPTSPGDAPGLPEEARTPKLTNREVGLTFDRMARSRFDAAEKDLGDLTRALVSGDARGATRCLKDIMPYCMSSFDGAKRPAVRGPERLNCGLVLGLPALTRDR